MTTNELTSKKGVLIIHINIRSLVNKLELVRHFITSNDIDCLCLSETWLRSIISDNLLNIDGYKLTRLDRPNINRHNRGGGLCIYTKETYEVELLTNITKTNENIECIGIKLSRANGGSINCITIYRPPKGDVIDCLNTLYELASGLVYNRKYNNIIHGDFNIDYSNKTCKWVKEIKTWEIKTGLKQLINAPTRVTTNTNSTIDLCFTDLAHISLSGVLDVNLSDHFPTFVLKKKARETKTSKSFTGRCYKDLSRERVIHGLEKYDTGFATLDPNLWWESLETTYCKVADLVCPIKTFNIKQDRPVYFTDEVSRAIIIRDKLFKKARVQRCDLLWRKAVKKRKEVKVLLKRAKRKFISDKFDDCKNNVNKYWRNMSNLLNRKKTSSITEILNSQGKITKGKEAATDINNYFCNIGPNLAEKVARPTLRFEVSSTACEFVWGNKIATEDVSKEIEKLDTTKSSGLGKLSTKILKECLGATVGAFTALLNCCVEQNVFPNRWKQATVVPIPKGLNSKEIKNIRPISLLPSPGKIFESFILQRMNNYLLANGLLCPEQSGFRKNYGTSDPIVELISHINWSFNNGNSVICIFVDMAKAFNCLDCDILARKLYNLGFRGSFHKLLCSYLSDREQSVNFNGEMSSMKSLSHGVAQGSILGPQMFSLYMNDLPLFFKELSLRMYADDTILFRTIDSKSCIGSQVKLINDELLILAEWCRYNRVTINVDKTKCVLFTSSDRKTHSVFPIGPPNLLLGGTKLEFVPNYRYLGVDLDQHLLMDLHIENIVKKTKPMLYHLGKLRYFISNETALRIYKTYILPILENGLYTVNCVKTSQINKLQKLQNHALRVIFRSGLTHPTFELHTRSNLLSLALRREACILRIINIKLIKGDEVFTIVTKKDNRTRDGTKCGVKLKTELPKLERYKKSINYVGPTLWNALPDHCKTNHWPPAFKRNIKMYLWEKFKLSGSTR